MRPISEFRFSEEQTAALASARKIAWLTLAYVCTSATLLYLTMGSSQAMRTSFFEDLVSAAPAATFLTCAGLTRRRPSPSFPYGFHRVSAIGYLVASLALVLMGLFLIADAAISVLAQERVVIGRVEIFGREVWAGWLMLGAVAYTGVPSFFLGRAKLALAPRIHDRILFADAKMMEADWKAELATGLGVVGAAFGAWWADPLGALFVSAVVLRDGVMNTVAAAAELAERHPLRIDRSAPDLAPETLRRRIEALDWVDEAQVRLRETGAVLLGEAFVRPAPGVEDLPRRVREARQKLLASDWRLHELTITPLDRLDPSERLAAPVEPGV